MKFTLNIETNDPAELARFVEALEGGSRPDARNPAEVKKESIAKKQAPVPQVETATPAPAAVTQAEPQAEPAVPQEQELIEAANAAAQKLGGGGPLKIKEHIAKTYQKADGSPGTLKQTQPAQRRALLEDLQKIAQGIKLL
jgi:hypothetical protein